MKSRQPQGTLAEQKQRHRARQRFFNAIMRAERLTKLGEQVDVTVHGVKVRTRQDEANLAVIRVRRGYALVEFNGNSKNLAIVLGGLGPVTDTVPESFVFDAKRLLFWCARV